MRDDLQKLFQSLVSQYRNKLFCIEKLASNEIQLRYLLSSDNTAGIGDFLLQDKEIFIELDSIEFDIQLLATSICKTAGIEKDNFENYFLSRNEEPLPEIKKLRTTIREKMLNLIKERDKLNLDMGKKMEEMQMDIDSLKKINEMDFKF